MDEEASLTALTLRSLRMLSITASPNIKSCSTLLYIEKVFLCRAKGNGAGDQNNVQHLEGLMIILQLLLFSMIWHCSTCALQWNRATNKCVLIYQDYQCKLLIVLSSSECVSVLFNSNV